METAELFRITLKTLLEKQPWGSQGKLADKLGMDRRHLNSFLNGKKPFSEHRRELIAKELGYTYIDFLLKGRKMFDDDGNVSLTTKQFEPPPLDEKLLCEVIELTEKGLLRNSMRLDPDLKARLITILYDYFISQEDHAVINKEAKVYQYLKLVG